jgi:hypothetical protein
MKVSGYLNSGKWPQFRIHLIMPLYTHSFQPNCNFICHFGGISPLKKTLAQPYSRRMLKDPIAGREGGSAFLVAAQSKK